MTQKEFTKWLPVMFVKDGCIVSKRGDLTFGWFLYPPVAYTVNEAGYDSIIRSFEQASRLLPPYTIIHKQDVFRYDHIAPQNSGFFLRDAYYRHFANRRYLNGYSYLYVTFSTRQNVEHKSGDSLFFGTLDKKVPTAEQIRRAADFASQFESVLRANDLLGIRRMKDDDIIRKGGHGLDEGVLADYLRLYDDTQMDYNPRFYNDHAAYDRNQVRVWYVEDSDSYPANVSSVKFQAAMSSRNSEVFLSGGSPIGLDLNIPHIVNRYMLMIPKGAIEKDLDMKKRINTSFSGISGEAAVNARELEEYILESANNSLTTVKTFMNLMAWGLPEEMPDIRNKVITAFRSEMDMNVVEEDFVAPLFHYAAIPGAEAELGYDNYLNSERTSFLCHGLWDSYDLTDKKGIIHLCDRDAMVPVTTDIQSDARAAGRINNMNALVVGPSGSGKSFTMNSLVQDFYEAGEHIMIIDRGDSYQGYATLVREESGGKDGVYITYDPARPIGFNPFHNHAHWNDIDETGEKVTSGIEFLLSVVMTIYKPNGGWTNAGSSALKYFITQFLDWWDNGVPAGVSDDLQDAYVNERRRRAVRNGLKFDERKALAGFRDPVGDIFHSDRKGTDPIFDDFYQYVTRIVGPLMRDENYRMQDIVLTNKIIDIDSFGVAMDMFKKDGVYGFQLNEEHPADLFKSRLTIFEVDQIQNNADLFPIWVLCIMHEFEDKMRSLPCQKVMIIEEAWSAIATETMAGYITWLWRTARKFRTSAVVVTQDINDLISSDIVKNAIIENTDVRILLDQRSNANNFENAINILGLTPMATNLVLSVNTNLKSGFKYKEAFFAIGPSYCNVFSVEVSPEQAICFETDKTLKAPLFRLAEQKGSFRAAIQEIVEKSGSKSNS